MKIGIITFHRAVNYGAVLQSYALCKSVRSLGYECEIIDYRSQFIEDYYDLKHLLLPKNWKRLISYIISNGNLSPNKERFTSFLRDNHVLSKEIYNTHSDLLKCEEIYDLFITGSDQVWNYATAGFDKAYFLDFVTDSDKKRSYAASFGFSEIPGEYINTYRELLKDFTMFSVRENAGEVIIRGFSNTPVTVDLDPTLLLNQDSWKSLASLPNDFPISSPKRFVLVYMIGEDIRILNLAKELAKKQKMDVIYITDRWCNRRGVVNARRVTPSEWLGLFDKADYIITNSFHGTAFSVNFEKRFVVLGNNQGKKKASRIETILTDLGLQERLTYDQNDAMAVVCKSINYNSIKTHLQDRRNNSLQNLSKELSH